MIYIKVPGYRPAVATLVNSGFIYMQANMAAEARCIYMQTFLQIDESLSILFLLTKNYVKKATVSGYAEML